MKQCVFARFVFIQMRNYLSSPLSFSIHVLCVCFLRVAKIVFVWSGGNESINNCHYFLISNRRQLMIISVDKILCKYVLWFSYPKFNLLIPIPTIVKSTILLDSLLKLFCFVLFLFFSFSHFPPHPLCISVSMCICLCRFAKAAKNNFALSLAMDFVYKSKSLKATVFSTGNNNKTSAVMSNKTGKTSSPHYGCVFNVDPLKTKVLLSIIHHRTLKPVIDF